MKNDILWVEVEGNTVWLHAGAQMPTEYQSSLYSIMFIDRSSMTRAEFERWSGVKLPKGRGIYGVRANLALIKKVRIVTEKKFVAAEHTTHHAEVEDIEV